MYEDSLDDLSYDLLAENIYPNDGLGRNILGNRDTIKNLSREDILNHYNTFLLIKSITFCQIHLKYSKNLLLIESNNSFT